MKYGTDGDKSKLPVATNQNRARTHQTREMDDGRLMKDGLHDGLFLGLFLRANQLWVGTIALEEEEDKVRGGVLEEEGSTLQEKEEELEKGHR